MNIPSQFTDEAKRLLEKESQRMTEELTEQALNEALRSRGEPVEVTATDVRRASMAFVRPRPQSLSPGLQRLLRVYLLTGILTSLFGLGILTYPYLKSLVQTDFKSQIGLITTITGLLVSFFSIFLLYVRDSFRSAEKRRQDKLKREMFED